jgi:hypothetical protein
MNNKKYFGISEKSTADALNYLGFKYMKFTNKYDNSTTYSFENTDEFQEARTKLWKLRQKYRK